MRPGMTGHFKLQQLKIRKIIGSANVPIWKTHIIRTRKITNMERSWVTQAVRFGEPQSMNILKQEILLLIKKIKQWE